MGGRSAVGVAVALWCGLLVGHRLDLGVLETLGALLVAAALGLIRGPRWAITLGLLAACMIAGAARGGAHRARIDSTRVGLGDVAQLFRLRGTVEVHPALESGEPLVLVRVRRARPALVRGALVRLRLPTGTTAEWGDGIEAVARLEAPSRIRNPGGFDARAAADAVDVVGVGRAFSIRIEPARGPAAWARATVSRWRRAIERVFAARLSPQARELVTPLVVGDRTAVSPELGARFRATGLTHLLALSGLHVTWMASIARGGVAACGLGSVPRALAGLACALFYVGLAGPIPSLMRAAVTESLVSAARVGGRALDAIQALAVSAVGLLIVSPGWADELGFQLSCVATLGLIAIAPRVVDSGAWRHLARSGLAVTLAAQVAAMPLVLGRFHAVSWIAPLANLVAVPLSGLLLAAAWIAAGIECAVPGFGGPWFGACEVASWALRAVVDLASRVPGAYLGTGADPAAAFLAGVGAALLALAVPGPRSVEARRRPDSRARMAGLLFGSILAATGWILAWSAPALSPARERAWLVALDVGQGDALALAFSDQWWLIDAGPRTPRHDAGESTVLPFLRWAGVRRLDRVLITHAHGDHAGGITAVLEGMTVRQLMAPPGYPGVPGPTARFPAAPTVAGQVLHREPRVRVLWPPGPESWAVLPVSTNDNSFSLVLEVRLGESVALLLADVDSTIERRLPVSSPVALLKVAHHGSGSSSGASFLAATRPGIGVISCGRANPFGHPSPGALERLRAAGVRSRRTDLEGALWFELGPRGVREVDWRRGRPVRPRVGAPLASSGAPRLE